MAGPLKAQIEELRRSIEGLEAQRAALGDAVVNPALAALRQQLRGLEEQAAAEAGPAEERRLVTILFMDMVGSTTAAEKLDPEEWRRLVEKLQGALGSAVTTYHGTIAQYLGDGLLAFFGAKEASEEDPENAVRAALAAQASVTELLSAENVQVRGGVHTGLVVVGELGEASHKEFTASGDAVNVAARLQAAAPASGILISHDTYRYIRGVFDLTPRPPLTVKGRSEPLQTYLVRQAKPRPFRTVTRGVAGVEARTIGREQELQALQAAYVRAIEGHGVVWAQLLGEPGVGKSRLVWEMDDWMDLRPETFRWLRARSFPDDAGQPFALVRRLWFERFQIAEDARLEQAEAKWVSGFQELWQEAGAEEAAHALGLLVGLPFEGSPHIKAMRDNPVQVRGRALVVSRELLKSIRGREPIVLLLEDLQWTDAASWEYLIEVFLADEGNSQPNGLFILGTARPEWKPPRQLTELMASGRSAESKKPMWGTQIHLAPLSDDAVRELARELLQRAEGVPLQVIDQLVERSEGMPYYTEEMINWFIDNGMLDTRSEPWRFLPDKLKEQPLPATLQHLLLTRLSSLSQKERAALQLGAIFGRRFWTGGVEALGAAGGDEMLGGLQPRGFVEAQPESAFEGDTEWSFRQSLLREVTYESVLKRERATLHKVAADWLEKQARQAGRLDEFAGLLGEHGERAGDLNAAANWYIRAGRRAMAQGAAREAWAFYARALDLLPPVDRERRWEAMLGLDDAVAELSEAEAWRASSAALLELAQTIGDENRVAEAYLRQAVLYARTGEEQDLLRTTKEALAAARRCENQALEAKSLAMLVQLGSDKQDHATTLQQIQEALRLARGLGDDGVLAYVLFRVAFAYLFVGDFRNGETMQREQIEIDRRLGNRGQEAAGLGNLGACYLAAGLYKQARAVVEQARGLNQALGARRQFAYDSLNLGEVAMGTGDLRKARKLIELALQEITPTQDVKGIGFMSDGLGFVMLEMGDAVGAGRRFREAYDLGHSKDTPSMVCEAASGLAACAVMQGELDEARKFADEAWAFIREHGWTALDTPGRIFRHIAETFDALGDNEQTRAVLEAAHRGLMGVAGTFDNPEWRRALLEEHPEHRALLEMRERKHGGKVPA